MIYLNKNDLFKINVKIVESLDSIRERFYIIAQKLLVVNSYWPNSSAGYNF